MNNLDCVLAGLAEKIDTLHSAALSSHRKSIEQAIECGRVLNEAKALVGHGQWLSWLEANTRVDERTARRWMRYANNAETVLAKSATVADLTFAEIDRDLSAAAVACDGVSADLQRFGDLVAELRKGRDVLADSVTFELLMELRAKERAVRGRRYRDLRARIDYAERHPDDEHRDLWECVAAYLIDCWVSHAEWLDEDVEAEAKLAAAKPEYVELCRHVAQLSPDDRRAYAYGVIFAEGRSAPCA